jgi:hypothetical protein
MVKTGLLKNTTCKKCGGKMTLESDMYGEYESCLSCGFVINVKIVSPSDKIDWANTKDVKQHA